MKYQKNKKMVVEIFKNFFVYAFSTMKRFRQKRLKKRMFLMWRAFASSARSQKFYSKKNINTDFDVLISFYFDYIAQKVHYFVKTYQYPFHEQFY